MKKIVFGAWVVILIFGLSAFAKFAFTPGAKGVSPKAWPVTSRLQPPTNKPELLVFLHPKCGCSHATLTELEKLLPEFSSQAVIKIVFNDLGDSALLESSQSFAKAKSLTPVEIVIDHDGYEAKTFDARTSGHALLYNEEGALVFSGGLTPSRGHEGDSLGSISVASWLRTRKMAWSSSDVFGCAMKEGD